MTPPSAHLVCHGHPLAVGHHCGMSDDEQAAQTGIELYDLAPPTARGPMLPTYTELRHPPEPRPQPRWTAPPLAEGFARVELDDDYYTGAQFSDWTGADGRYPARVFDIPREQYERWVSARDAYAAMQAEVEAMREERLRTPGWAPPGWVRTDKPYQVQP